MFFNQDRLINAMIRLWARVVGHSHFLGVAQVVGISIKVGISSFNIVGGLGFEGGRCRVCGRWQLVGQGLRQLRRLKMPEGVLVRPRSL